MARARIMGISCIERLGECSISRFLYSGVWSDLHGHGYLRYGPIHGRIIGAWQETAFCTAFTGRNTQCLTDGLKKMG